MTTPILAQYRGQFGKAEARHLLSRSGFGATPHQIDRYAKAGLDATLGAVFEGDTKSEKIRRRWQRRRALSRRISVRGDSSQLQASWFLSAATSPLPLREKIALFWHDHFATANTKVDDLVAMEAQMSIFLDHGLGSFRELLGRVAKDPAMLVFLDGAQNNKTAPNENFAREVLELFTLGIGNYTETDIQNAARAFTGWQVVRGSFKVETNAHDAGSKTIFGKTGNFGGEDILDLCIEKVACARFIVNKLAYYFLGVTPSKKVVDSLALSLQKHEFSIEGFLREFFASAIFFDASVRQGRIKSPVEFLVGVVRCLDAKFSATRITEHAQAMGQEIYNPPGVAGWPNGRDWINSTTIVARNRFVLEVGQGKAGDLKFRPGIPGSTQTNDLSFSLIGLNTSPATTAKSISEKASAILTQPQAQLG